MKVWLDLEFTGVHMDKAKIREMAFIVGRFERHLKIGYGPECPRCGKAPYKTSTHGTITVSSLTCMCKCGMWIYGNEQKIKEEIGNKLKSRSDFLGYFGNVPPKFPGQKTAKQAMRIFLKTLPEKLGGEGGTCEKCGHAVIRDEFVSVWCGNGQGWRLRDSWCPRYEGRLMKWAGYNIAYDLKWLKAQMFPKYDPIWAWFEQEPLDVLKEVRIMRNTGGLPVKDCRLCTVAEYFKIPHTPHNALSDIRATRYVYKRLKTIKKGVEK